ncbi:MAG TPA: YheU family protein [Steroidobacteraceae bacterium]|jgi:hypothetical protein|nr:YheU family protein [Steroidobacteraceae bacterium]
MPDDSSGAGSGDPVTVPHTALAADVLRAVIESFILREGTDYGERELPLDDKVGRVMRLLERGEARIVFDPQTETVDIVTVRGAPAGKAP